MNLSRVIEVAEPYQKLRLQHPELPAQFIKAYVDGRYDEPFKQCVCGVFRGHEWVVSEETDRCYCAYCGADGDA